MVDSHSVLISTNNPILAVRESESTLTYTELPPYDFESETGIKHFHFITKDLRSLLLQLICVTVHFAMDKREKNRCAHASRKRE